MGGGGGGLGQGFPKVGFYNSTRLNASSTFLKEYFLHFDFDFKYEYTRPQKQITPKWFTRKTQNFNLFF